MKSTYKKIEEEVLGIDKSAKIYYIRKLWRYKNRLKRENEELKKEIAKLLGQNVVIN